MVNTKSNEGSLRTADICMCIHYAPALLHLLYYGVFCQQCTVFMNL